MDVFSTLGGQAFVWSSEKANRNFLQQGLLFEQARETFLEPSALYEDARVPEEARQAYIGLTADYRLFFVVHVTQQADVLRIISVRLAETAERRRHEDD